MDMKSINVSLTDFQDYVTRRMIGAYASSHSSVIRYIVQMWITDHAADLDERLKQFEAWKAKQ